MKGVTDIKKWVEFSKPVVILLVIGLLLYYSVTGIIERRNGQETAREEPLGGLTRIEAFERYDTPIPVKAGTWSDWMPALDVMMSINPSSAKIEYERMDALGRVISREGKPGGHIDWNDTAIKQRIKSNVDIVYRLKRL